MIWTFETKGFVHNLLDKELLMFRLFVYFSMLENYCASNTLEWISNFWDVGIKN